MSVREVSQTAMGAAPIQAAGGPAAMPLPLLPGNQQRLVLVNIGHGEDSPLDPELARQVLRMHRMGILKALRAGDFKVDLDREPLGQCKVSVVTTRSKVKPGTEEEAHPVPIRGAETVAESFGAVGVPADMNLFIRILRPRDIAPGEDARGTVPCVAMWNCMFWLSCWWPHAITLRLPSPYLVASNLCCQRAFTWSCPL